MVVVLQAELIGVLFEGHAHRPRGKRLVGVVAAPQAIDTVQRDAGACAAGHQAAGGGGRIQLRTEQNMMPKVRAPTTGEFSLAV